MRGENGINELQRASTSLSNHKIWLDYEKLQRSGGGRSYVLIHQTIMGIEERETGHSSGGKEMDIQVNGRTENRSEDKNLTRRDIKRGKQRSRGVEGKNRLGKKWGHRQRQGYGWHCGWHTDCRLFFYFSALPQGNYQVFFFDSLVQFCRFCVFILLILSLLQAFQISFIIIFTRVRFFVFFFYSI